MANAIKSGRSKKQYELPDGVLTYTMDIVESISGSENTKEAVREKIRLCIVAYSGSAGMLVVPSHIDGYPVYAIGRKVFFGNRHLQKIILPDTMQMIGDWAFAKCHMLREIVLPKREIYLGSQVFLQSKLLRKISFAGSGEGMARLFAMAAVTLEAEYLVSPMQAGDDNWYSRLDARILAFLGESEEHVLKDLVYCAEEDMGAKQEACLRKQAQQKAELAFLRLAYPAGMTPAMKRSLTDYLRQRTKGCQDEAAWETIKQCSEDTQRYFTVLYEIGAVHERNIAEMLEDLEDNYIELKAALLRKWQDREQEAKVWDSLRLI